MWQDRKVGLLEVELLVSSKCYFCLNRVVACVFWEIKCCVCDIVFALCKINLFSVKPLWGFILVSSGTMFWLLSFSEETICF